MFKNFPMTVKRAGKGHQYSMKIEIMKRKKSELFLCIEVLGKDVEKQFDQAEAEDSKNLFIRDNTICNE